MNRYNAFGPWLRRKFGERVFKVSVDGGFTCPNRDGTAAWGGCTYCNNDSFRPDGAAADKSIEQQIQEGTDYLARRFGARRFLVYWQSYTNTYAPVERLSALFQRSLEADSRIAGIAIGTRPDCIEEEKLDMLQAIAGRRFLCLEYGLESIYDSTLKRINRGHDFACFRDAVKRTQTRGIPVAVHVILGFPGETREQMLRYTVELNDMKIDFVKIHHLHVVHHTPLAKEYLANPFPTFGYHEWIGFVADFLERLDPAIVVQRLYGWTPHRHLIAPVWGRKKSRIQLDILEELERRNSWQGKASSGAAQPRPKVLKS